MRAKRQQLPDESLHLLNRLPCISVTTVNLAYVESSRDKFELNCNKLHATSYKYLQYTKDENNLHCNRGLHIDGNTTAIALHLQAIDRSFSEMIYMVQEAESGRATK